MRKCMMMLLGCFLLSMNVWAQSVTLKVSGVVADSEGITMPGVSVSVKDAPGVGVATDIDGNFNINVAKSQILVFTYIGYATKEYVVEKSVTNLKIVLNEDLEQLEEVVVVGYGTQRKINLTGAIIEVKAADVLEERPITHVGQALQGQIPGLVVSRADAKPGEGFSYNIRGTTSLNGGSPLILVDGVEMSANTVPPEEIESITVLKDAASAAIYGSRAAFGVILITTKKGVMNGKMKISYSGNFSWSTPTDFSDKVDPVTQIEYGAYAWGNKNGDYVNYWGRSAEKWVDIYNTTTERVGVRKDGVWYPTGDVNMIEEMVETGSLQRHNLSFSGGSDKVAYYVNAGVTEQDGILVRDRDTYNRKNLSAKINTDVTEWLSFELNTGYIQTRSEMPWIPNGDWYLYDNAWSKPRFWLTGFHPEDGIAYGFSPQMIDLGALGYSEDDNFRTSALVTIKPVKGLTLNGRYSYRRHNSEDFTHVNSYKMNNPINGVSDYYQNKVNSIKRSNGKTDYSVIDLWAQYKKSFNSHNVSAMVGYNQEESSYRSFSAKQESLFSDDLPSLNLGNGNKYVSDSANEWSTRSVFYRFNYDYAGKYLLEVVGRYDGTSRFPENDRFVFVPSASVAWRLSEESFMDWSREVLDNLKLRASYGVQGNQSIGNYAFLPSMGNSKADWIVGKEKPVTITPAGIVSDSFTWETVKTTNLGVDVSLLNSRLNVTVEGYKRQTEGMLTAATELPAVLGTSAPDENAADLEVNGWELSLKWNDKIGDVNYSVGVNLYDSQMEITKYDNPAGLYGEYYNGRLGGEIWGYETDRLFAAGDFTTDAEGDRAYQDGVPTQNYIFGSRVPSPGDVKYKDLDGNGKIDAGKGTLEDPGDKKIIGNSTSRYQFGVNLGASYRGFDISMFFQGVAKKDMWIGNSLVFAYDNAYGALFSHTTDFWREDNQDAYYPRPIAGEEFNSQVQSKYLQNGAYMRLKNLTIGYSLPTSFVNKLFLSKIRLYASGENLFTVTGLPDGVDPEIGGSYEYPFQKEFSFGVDIRF